MAKRNSEVASAWFFLAGVFAAAAAWSRSGMAALWLLAGTCVVLAGVTLISGALDGD